MKVFGITGGVGAGKSEVLTYLGQNYDATVIQADEAGYLVMLPGGECYGEIVKLFGRQITTETGELDRKRIAEIVFQDEEKLKALNSIVHPAVKRYIKKAIAAAEKAGTEYVFVEAALLIEEKYDEICDELWYIYADEEVRKERLIEGRGYSEKKVREIMANQLSEDEFSSHCIFEGSETTSLLIDAGISGKRVEAGLAVLDRSAKELDGILVTHEHSDHIQGLGVLARRYGIPIYATDGTIQAMQQTKSLGKFPEGIFHTIHADDTFTLGDIAVHPFTISHDAAEPVGYRMESGGKSIAIATDLGVYSDYTVQNLTGLDAVLLEANHDENMLAVGPYPYPLKQRIAGAKGHLSNLAAGHLLCEILHDNLQEVLLGHLSKENNYEALAFETVACEVTTGDNPYRSGDFHLAVAKRSEVSPLIEV